MDKEKSTLKNAIKDNFTVVTNQLINDQTLSWAAKGVLCYLLSKPTDWQFFIGDIVKHAACTEYQVQKLIKELETAGYIKRYKDVKPGTNKLYWVWEINIEKENLRQPEIATIVNCDGRKIVPYTNTNTDTNTDLTVKPLRDINNTDVLFTSLPPKGAVADHEDDWEQFWKSYTPVKAGGRLVGKGSKSVARKKYMQIRKKGVTHDELMQGMLAYIRYCKENAILSCGVAVFLNQERWKDDYGGAVALARQMSREERKQQEQMDIYRDFLERNK